MADHMPLETPATADGSYILLLIFSWLWVGLPLAWGVRETVRTALDLFR